jgi:hypothetical protein
MEFGGWIMLGLMWGGVLLLGIYCFGKILTDDGDTEL